MAAGSQSLPWARSSSLNLHIGARLIWLGPLVVGLLVALPLVILLVSSFNVAAPGREAVYSLENWRAAFSDGATVSSLWNSVALGAARTAISLPIAVALAWLIARSDMPGRTLIELFCWVGIFLPLLPLTFGWILLLDPRFGLVNMGIRQVIPGLESGPFNI